MDFLKRLNWFSVLTVLFAVTSLVLVFVFDETAKAAVMTGLAYVCTFLGVEERKS